MKTISEDYKIYLTEDKTLLFYGTLKNQELDKPQIVINDSTGVFTMLAEEMAKKSRDEILPGTSKASTPWSDCGRSFA